MNQKFMAVANTSKFGLTKGQQYLIENPKTGSVYVYDAHGSYLMYCRKDCFDKWREIQLGE